VTARALALFVATALSLSCDSTGQSACDCDDPTITINIPTDVAASATLKALSGPACEGVLPSCTNQTNGCSQYQFDAAGAGDCQIEVDFATGSSFNADITVIAADDPCCNGFFASPPSAATVDVPAPSPDAGG